MPQNRAVDQHVYGWVRYLEAAVPVAFAIAICVQRGVLLDPTWETLVAFGAAVPWILYLFRIVLPFWLASLVVYAAVWALISQPTNSDIAPFFLLFVTFVFSATRSVVEGALVGAGSLAVLAIAAAQDEFVDSWPWAVGIVFMWGGGVLVGTLLRVVDQLHAAQADLAERAATEERQRIAREIHDVIAHSLAVTMLHLTGARMALRRDIDDAERALIRAEELGRQSLAEIRATVGLLGAPAGAAPALPSANDIRELVGEFAAAGLQVDVEIVGDPTVLSPTTGLALYRIAQESLTNTVKHAPGANASVRLDINATDARLVIENRHTSAADPDTNHGGLGVTGMRDRAAALGGTFEAAAVDGTWRVVALLPRELAPA